MALRTIAPDLGPEKLTALAGDLSFCIQAIHIVYSPTPRGLQAGTARQARKELKALSVATDAFYAAVHGLSKTALDRLHEVREFQNWSNGIAGPRKHFSNQSDLAESYTKAIVGNRLNFVRVTQERKFEF